MAMKKTPAESEDGDGLIPVRHSQPHDGIFAVGEQEFIVTDGATRVPPELLEVAIAAGFSPANDGDAPAVDDGTEVQADPQAGGKLREAMPLVSGVGVG